MIPRGYPVPGGYMGWVMDRYMLFATEDEYIEYTKENAETRGHGAVGIGDVYSGEGAGGAERQD